MKFTYVPVQDPDGSWSMVAKLSPAQLREADKARRRILNIKEDDNPWWMLNPETFGVPRKWPWSDTKEPFFSGDEIRVPLMYGTGLYVEMPRMNSIISGITGV